MKKTLLILVLIGVIFCAEFCSSDGLDLHITNKSGKHIDSITIYYRSGEMKIQNLAQDETRKVLLQFSSETGIDISWNGKRKTAEVYIIKKYARKFEIILKTEGTVEWIYTENEGLFGTKVDRGIAIDTVN